MNKIAHLDAPTLENVLLMREWGKWARNGANPRLGFARPGWINQIKQNYDDENKFNDLDELLPDIDNDYGLLIDKCLLQLPEYTRYLMVLYYQQRISLNRIARLLGKSRQRVSTDRDCALSALYGFLVVEGELELAESA